MKPNEHKIDSEIELERYIRDLRKDWKEHKYLIAEHKTAKLRTMKQNAALHLFLGWLAEDLNAAGMDMRRVLKQEVDIPWTTESCKEHLWRPIQEAVINKSSTTEADRIEYTAVYDVLAHHMATKLGITVPEWPKKKQEDAA